MYYLRPLIDFLTKTLLNLIIFFFSFCLADYFCTNHDIAITDNHLPPKQNDICYTIVPSKDVIKQQQKQKQQQRSQRSTRGWNTPSSANSSGQLVFHFLLHFHWEKSFILRYLVFSSFSNEIFHSYSCCE